jgi:hypothetical protein
MTACLVANAPVFNSFLHAARQHQTRQQYQENASQDVYVSAASQRRRAQMPVTGQDSFGSLTRNDGLGSVSGKVHPCFLSLVDEATSDMAKIKAGSQTISGEQPAWRDSGRTNRVLVERSSSAQEGRIGESWFDPAV